MTVEDIRSKVAIQLGQVVIAFNSLEIAAGDLIRRLLNEEDRVGDVLIAVLSFSTKVRMLEALDFKLPEQHRGELRQLLDQAKRVNSKRNDLIHSEYTVYGRMDETVYMTIRRLRDAHKHPQDYEEPIEGEQVGKLAAEAEG